MKIEPFQMERWQSTWEHSVRFNLSESGVHPMTALELLELAGEDPREVLSQRLGYTQSNGSGELRERIAALYPGARVDNVLVSNGGAEANYITAWSLLEPGDTVGMQIPNYMQMWGLARTFAGRVWPFPLVEERDWAPDLEALESSSAAGVKLILVTHPNNPTGAVLRETEMERIVAAAERAGAWLVADEIYAGAELDGQRSPSFWGRYDRLVVTAGLSKAYGLPGLRLGWALGPPALIERLWASKDFTTIAPGALSDRLARIALRPDTEARIRERARRILRDNLDTLTHWLLQRRDVFHFVRPRAGAICYVRYDLDINSSELARRLKDEQSVLVVPGDHFDMDGYLRLGFGCPGAELIEALDRIEALVRSLRH